MKKFFIVFCFVILIVISLPTIYAADDDCELCPPRYCPEGKIRECGTQLGRCVGAEQKCVEGNWGACNITRINEVCNGIDDDCDGIIDDINDELGVIETSCLCYDGGEPRNETCNGIDDNCNGIIDENAGCCEPGERRDCGPEENVGICKKGTSRCNEKHVWDECKNVVYPRIEIENDIDDNCDGIVDNLNNLTEESFLLIVIIVTAVLILSILIGLFIVLRKDGHQPSQAS